jgi:hypothetical protein
VFDELTIRLNKNVSVRNNMIQTKMQSKAKLFFGLGTRGGNVFSDLGR